jgi:hypothetical protein
MFSFYIPLISWHHPLIPHNAAAADDDADDAAASCCGCRRYID